MLDVYCFGLIASGVIHRIRDRFPAADGYGEIVETLENHTGEAGAGAIVLARLGARVALDGNWIGDTPAGRQTLRFLLERGIDCTGLSIKAGYPGAYEITFSDGATRTVFGRYNDLFAAGPQWTNPRLECVTEAAAVCVDPGFGEAALMVARAAKAAGKPVVTCDARADSPLATLADVLAISGEMRAREYPETFDDEEARQRLFCSYLERCPGLTVFTSGAAPLWYGRGQDRGHARQCVAPGVPHQMPAFAIDVVDCAGAGDSFRAGLTFGVLRGWNDEDAVRFASAVAALVCTTTPGCLHSPTLDEVRVFLASRGLTGHPLLRG